MAKSGAAKPTSDAKKPPRDEVGLLFDLVTEVPPTFHKLGAASRSVGAGSQRGGHWGLLRNLSQDGPQTVPQLARRRPVSRQHIQNVVNELIVKGLVRLKDNPAHKRSKLVELTDKGVVALDGMTARILEWVDHLAPEFEAEDLQVAVRTLQKLQTLIKIEP